MLNNEEILLVNEYAGFYKTKESILAALQDVLPYITENGIKSDMTRLIEKVRNMSDAQLSLISF